MDDCEMSIPSYHLVNLKLYREAVTNLVVQK